MHLFVPVSFLVGSVGPGEVFLLFLIILLLFGPRRLPEIARQIGKTLAELRRVSHDFQRQVQHMDEELTPSDDKFSPRARAAAAPALPPAPAKGDKPDQPAPPDAQPSSPNPIRPVTVERKEDDHGG